MSYLAWICEGCGKPDTARPWNCPTCHKEVCEKCFDKYAHCKECSARLKDSEMISAGEAEGFDFTGNV